MLISSPRPSTAFLAVLGLLHASCGDDKKKEARPVLGENDVRITVRVMDFLEQSELPPVDGKHLGDMTVIEVVKAPEELGPLGFDVLHEGAAPANGMWRDVGADYEVTLNRGFFAATEPPIAAGVRDPKRVSKPGAAALPIHHSLGPRYSCMAIEGPHLPGAPLPPIVGPGLAGVILPPEAGPELLNPCLRVRPKPATLFWLPSETEVRELEQRLPEFLKKHAAPPHTLQWKSLHLYARQYVGVIRDEGRAIYANVFPLSESGGWRCYAMTICDKSRRFFGVEYDVATGAFTSIAFNKVE